MITNYKPLPLFGPGLVRPTFDGPTLTPTGATHLTAPGAGIGVNSGYNQVAPAPLVHLWIPDAGSDPDHSAVAVQQTPDSELSSLHDSHLKRCLVKLIRQRIKRSAPPPQLKTLKSPVGMFFTRDSKTSGANDIREEIVNSFEYWSADAGEHFDMFFPGWYMRNKKLHFNTKRFLEYRLEIEKHSKWRHSGETDILLLDFDYDLETKETRFDFKNAIHLKVEELVRDKTTGSLAALLSLIQNTARESDKYHKDGAIWQISGKIGYHKGGGSFWHAIRKTFLKEFSKVYDDLRPFAVVDLSLNS
ncbi:MAG TPA: hypothetical protein VGO50_14830 [Pyrinomonadaceae bacterium]|jgi:hypothetical protein|nr:hypothetical protein [Pyrinomonadaceae bacterium]